jgi:hypothetical protein
VLCVLLNTVAAAIKRRVHHYVLIVSDWEVCWCYCSYSLRCTHCNTLKEKLCVSQNLRFTAWYFFVLKWFI